MEEKLNLAEAQEPRASSPESKKAWQKPKLTFVKPKLTNHGKLEDVTGQFFGGFTPPASNGSSTPG